MQIPQSPSVTDVLDDVDDYQQTIESLVALSNVVIHDYTGQAVICKAMRWRDDTSKKITPDIVAEIDQYALVAEVKKSLPRNQSFWDDILSQLQKYDKDLIGWEKNPPSHDLVLMCNQIVSYQAAEYLRQAKQDGRFTPSRNLCILAFNRNTQRQIFLFLKKEDGNLGHVDLDGRLKQGISVPLERVLEQLSAVKFYDTEPNVVYTMAVLWDHVFPRLPNPEALRGSRGRKTIEIEASIDLLLQELRTYFAPPGNREVVERKWVKDAMNSYVKIHLAKKANENDRFVIYFKKMKTEDTTLEFFAKRLCADIGSLDAYFSDEV
jgi:hypothetical protein